MKPNPSLVLLPGTLCTELAFRHQHTHLSDVARVHVLPLTEGETVGESAAWVLRHAPERFALAGFSQGAITAFEIMRQAPERVVKLALLSANPQDSTEAQRALWQRWKVEARENGLAEIASAFANNVHPSRREDVWLRYAIESMALETGVETFVRQLEMLSSRIDSRPSLAAIRCPTLLIVGRQDTVTPLALHEEMRAHIPHAALVPIERCGHYCTMEQPEAVTALMRYWLQYDGAGPARPHADDDG